MLVIEWLVVGLGGWLGRVVGSGDGFGAGLLGCWVVGRLGKLKFSNFCSFQFFEVFSFEF